MLGVGKIGEIRRPGLGDGRAACALMRAAWPRLGAASIQCGRIRIAEKKEFMPPASIGGLAARPPPEQRKMDRPLLRQRLCLRKTGRISRNICLQRKARPAESRGELFRFNQAQKV